MSLGAESEAAFELDPLIGQRIKERYRVERVHSRGGSSVVYAARHEELKREVALKVLDAASAADPAAVERFEVEARMGLALAHNNLVSVSDFGRLPDGRPFLVMPMIAGTDLATLIAHEGPQHPRRVANLLKGVAAALDLVHARGCVHRDIKSENLMHVVNDDGSETTCVLDFGLASVRAPNPTSYVDSSGTPEFMAPEAFSGEAVDHRGDIYSLATVAFELMTGSLPFQSADLAELKHKKCNEAALTLSQGGQAEFPEALEKVIARALARRREDRQASASELIRALEAAADQMTVWPPPRTTLRRVSKYPTLVGTGARTQKRTQMQTAATRNKTMRGVADAQTLGRLTERAARITSPKPPAPLGSEALAALPPPPAVPLFDAVHVPAPDTLIRPRPSPVPDRPLHDSTPPTPSASERARAMKQRLQQLKSPERSVSDPPSSAPPPGAAVPAAEPERALPERPSTEDALARLAALQTADDFRPRAKRKLWHYAVAVALVASVAVGVLVPLRKRAQPSRAARATPAALPVHAVPVASANAVTEPAASEPHAIVVPAPAQAGGETASAPAPAKGKKTGDAPHAVSAHANETPAPRSEHGAAATKSVARARMLGEQASDVMIRGEFAAAATAYQQAIAADADYAPAWRGKGLALERMGRAHDAAAAFRQYLTLEPNAGDADKIRQRLIALEAAP